MNDIEQANIQVQKVKRRKIPHWTCADSLYFVTWRLFKNQMDLLFQERDLVAAALLHFNEKRYEIYCFVVMNDHVHVLVMLKPSQTLQRTIHTWKSYTANRLQRQFGRKGSVWQEEYYDRLIRTDKEFYRIAKYILYNPYKRWRLANYRWAWWHGYTVTQIVEPRDD